MRNVAMDLRGELVTIARWSTDSSRNAPSPVVARR